MAERSILGITEERVNRAEDIVEETTDIERTDDMFRFIRGVNKRISREQRELYLNLKTAKERFQVGSALAYGYAAAVTYEMLPDEVRKIELTQDQVETSTKSLLDSNQDENGCFDWYLDKLIADSPYYINWLIDTLEDIEDPEEKRDFTYGSVLVTLPFYQRGEAFILANQIWYRQDRPLLTLLEVELVPQ